MRVSKIALIPFVAGAAFAAPVQHQNAVARDGFPDLGGIFDGGLPQLPQINIGEVITNLNQTLGGIIPAIPSDVLTKLEEILGQVQSGASSARFHGESFDVEGLPDILGGLDLPPFLQSIIEMIIKFLSGLGNGGGLPGLPGLPGGPLPTGLPTELPSGFPTDLPTGFPTELPTGFPTDLPGGPGLPTDTELPPIPTGFPTEIPGAPTETELPIPIPTELPTEAPIPTELPTEIPGGPGLPSDTEIPPIDLPTALPSDTELPGLPTDLPSAPSDTELPGLPSDTPIGFPTDTELPGLPTDLPTLPSESVPVEAPLPTESSPIGAPGPVAPVPTDDGSMSALPFPGRD